jgi:hydroxymethylpyrimidine pyrophosphatase-like HAD family hydrolase
MQYQALASDYDGTLAEHGRLAPATRAALVRLRRSGRKVILVTGRELVDLRRVCPELTLFDRVVTENGAVLVDPIVGAERLLAQGAPPELFVQLGERGLSFLYRGQVIVATTEENETLLQESLRAVGLDWRLILNKGAVMALPAGVDKAFGLRAALEEVGVDPESTVGVGDAENDVSLLEACGLGVAVAGALESLKAIADLVTPSDHGEGVVELIDCWLTDGLANIPKR